MLESKISELALPTAPGSVANHRSTNTEETHKPWQLPDIETLKGRRHRAILATMLGCGLRRREIADLTFDHLQRRELEHIQFLLGHVFVRTAEDYLGYKKST